MIQFIFDNILKLFAILLPIAPVVFAQIKQYRATKKDNKIITDSLKELYSQNEKIEKSVTSHQDVTKFNLDLRNGIQIKANQAISYSKLDPEFKAIMKEISRRLESLAFGFYYNKNRGKIYEIEDFVNEEINDLKNCYSALIKNIDKSKITGWDKFGQPKLVYFDKFMLDENTRRPFCYFDSLKYTLDKNGFDNKNDENSPDFIETMIAYTKNTLNKFVDDVNEWNKIKEVPEPAQIIKDKYHND
jgi:hypothetical protein